MTRRVFVSASDAGTEALAAQLGARLHGGGLVALDGEMGAGKTTFVRGLARGLGISDPVASPTFALAHVYAAGDAGTELHHVDAWQLRRSEAFLADGGLDSVLAALEAEHVVAIEWAQRIADRLVVPHLRVALSHAAANERRMEFTVAQGPAGATPGSAARAMRLEQALAGLVAPPDVREETR